MLQTGHLVRLKSDNDSVMFRTPLSNDMAGVFIEPTIHDDTYLVIKIVTVLSPFDTGRQFFYVKLLSMKSNKYQTYQTFDDPELDFEIISNG